MKIYKKEIDMDTVFGDAATLEEPVSIRSHDSRHESEVPIISNQKAFSKYKLNLDIFVERFIKPPC